MVTIEILARDEAAVAFYMTEYKPFRLRALQTDPSCFGSSYDREIVFTDEQWSQRLLNPRATVVLATTGKTRTILSSATIFEINGVSDLVGIPDEIRKSMPLHWSVNGVYTRPESRRSGISRQTMMAAEQAARDLAYAQKRDCLLTVLVDEYNEAARALYQKCGYVACYEGALGDRKYLQLYQFFPRNTE